MSNLTKPPFNEDGPVIVPPAAFDIYRSNESLYSNYYNASKIWFDHTDDNGILRLCIRDILRQNYYNSCGYHQMFIDYTELLHNDRFYETLSRSEKIRNEFVEEAYYNIEHSLVPLSKDDADTEDGLAELLELLLILENNFHVKNLDVERLWAFHPVNQPHDAPFAQAWNQLKFCVNGMCLRIKNTKSIPRFYAETWNLLKNTIIQCIQICNEKLKKRGNVYSEQYPYNPNSQLISAPNTAEEMLAEFCKKIYHGSRIVIDAIYFLEIELPASVGYLPWGQLQKILPVLPIEDYAFYCLQRHVDTAHDEELHALDPKFLHWAIGLAYRGQNLDGGKTINRLTQVLPPITIK